LEYFFRFLLDFLHGKDSKMVAVPADFGSGALFVLGSSI
jgi:hypothetical protein